MRYFTTLALASGVAALPGGPASYSGSDVTNSTDGSPSSAGFTNATFHKSSGGQANCVSGMIPVKASTKKGIKFDYTIPTNESVVTNTWVEFATKNSPFSDAIIAGTEPISGTYQIGATYCVPANETATTKLQLLTHGVGFDRTYWDFAPYYSYVDVASSNGYATFFYDRLSVGTSSKPPPLQVQTPIELAILEELVDKLRAGDISATKFKTVIGAGHSYGSILTQALTATVPSALDGAILTGFSVYEGGMPAFALGLNLDIAAQNQPHRFSGLDNGYLVANDVKSVQIGFFRYPGFAAEILEKAAATKGSLTVAELFSATAVTAAAKNFTGPVAVVNGMEDLPFCFGNCTFNGNLAKKVFPKLYPKVPAAKQGAYLAANAGHGLNLHYSAPKAYAYIQDFLKKNL